MLNASSCPSTGHWPIPMAVTSSNVGSTRPPLPSSSWVGTDTSSTRNAGRSAFISIAMPSSVKLWSGNFNTRSCFKKGDFTRCASASSFIALPIRLSESTVESSGQLASHSTSSGCIAVPIMQTSRSPSIGFRSGRSSSRGQRSVMVEKGTACCSFSAPATSRPSVSKPTLSTKPRPYEP